jgi:hypothetical protein
MGEGVMSALDPSPLPSGTRIGADVVEAVLGAGGTSLHHPNLVELKADAESTLHEVCIRPGLSTNLIFDSTLARVELAGRERFRVVLPGENALTLVPSGALEDGERVPVTVHFLDGAAPTVARFVLAVHPSQAERQVEVTRRPRTLDSYREGEQQARADARRGARPLHPEAVEPGRQRQGRALRRRVVPIEPLQIGDATRHVTCSRLTCPPMRGTGAPAGNIPSSHSLRTGVGLATVPRPYGMPHG